VGRRFQIRERSECEVPPEIVLGAYFQQRNLTGCTKRNQGAVELDAAFRVSEDFGFGEFARFRGIAGVGAEYFG